MADVGLMKLNGKFCTVKYSEVLGDHVTQKNLGRIFDLKIISMIFRGSSRSLVNCQEDFWGENHPQESQTRIYKKIFFFILMNFDFVMISNMSLF